MRYVLTHPLYSVKGKPLELNLTGYVVYPLFELQHHSWATFSIHQQGLNHLTWCFPNHLDSHDPHPSQWFHTRILHQLEERLRQRNAWQWRGRWEAPLAGWTEVLEVRKPWCLWCQILWRWCIRRLLLLEQLVYRLVGLQYQKISLEKIQLMVSNIQV